MMCLNVVFFTFFRLGFCRTQICGLMFFSSFKKHLIHVSIIASEWFSLNSKYMYFRPFHND